MKNLKTYQCKEHNEIFYVEALDIDEAEEFASMYGGVVIKQITKKN